MADLTLAIRDSLPERFLTAAAPDLANLFDGPTLVHLPGRRTPALFVSILLHGNEPVGLHAVQAVLRKHATGELPRALSIFVGNVQAARAGVRRVDGQPDYNRVWPGGDHDATAEAAVARAVLAEMRTRGTFASLDLHNNTGVNPLYACVATRDPHHLQLATLFSRLVIHFERPTGTQVGAFGVLCPAIAVECGKAGNPEGEARAAALVEAALRMAEPPTGHIAAHDIDLFHTIGVVHVHETVELELDPRIERYNFRDLAPGTVFGRVRDAALPLRVLDPRGHDVTARFFEVSAGVLATTCSIMPAMLTTDPRAIRQDCLCYLMERATPAPR